MFGGYANGKTTKSKYTVSKTATGTAAASGKRQACLQDQLAACTALYFRDVVSIESYSTGFGVGKIVRHFEGRK